MGFRKSEQNTTLSNALLPSNLDVQLVPRNKTANSSKALLPSSEGLLLIKEGLLKEANNVVDRNSTTAAKTVSSPIMTTSTNTQAIPQKVNTDVSEYLLWHRLGSLTVGAGVIAGTYVQYNKGRKSPGFTGYAVPILAGLVSSILVRFATVKTHQFILSH